MSYVLAPLRTAAPSRPATSAIVVAASLVGLLTLAYLASRTPGNDWRMPALVLVGAAIGFVLFRASFGFSSAFRSLVEERNPHAFRAHAVMIGVASAAFLPLLVAGEFLGFKIFGPATTIGPSFMLGALMFGIGMQIGGGCASGTLYGLGGGNLKLAGTLVGFIVGSVVGASHMEFWWSLPAVEPIVLQNELGLWPALAVQGALLGAMFWLAGRYGRAPGASAEVPQPLAVRLFRGGGR